MMHMVLGMARNMVRGIGMSMGMGMVMVMVRGIIRGIGMKGKMTRRTVVRARTSN